MAKSGSSTAISGRIDLGERPKKDTDELSTEEWGYRDSGFAIDDEGAVIFTGSRYPISGSVLPELLPWASTVLDAPLDPQRPLRIQLSARNSGPSVISGFRA